MLDQLKIPAAAMRRGPDGMNRQSPNYQNTDEAKANPWPNLPEMMETKARKPVTTPEIWWKERVPELFEYFDADGKSLGEYSAPVSKGGLSFLGVAFPNPAVARVRIEYGNGKLGPDNSPSYDVAVMDDFIYGEPSAQSG